MEALFKFALAHANMAAVKSCLKRGASLETTDNRGYTPLFIAIEHNQYELCKFLLDNGANVDHVSNDGSTPKSLAITISPSISELISNFSSNNSFSERQISDEEHLPVDTNEIDNSKNVEKKDESFFVAEEQNQDVEINSEEINKTDDLPNDSDVVDIENSKLSDFEESLDDSTEDEQYSNDKMLLNESSISDLALSALDCEDSPFSFIEESNIEFGNQQKDGSDFEAEEKIDDDEFLKSLNLENTQSQNVQHDIILEDEIEDDSKPNYATDYFLNTEEIFDNIEEVPEDLEDHIQDQSVLDNLAAKELTLNENIKKGFLNSNQEIDLSQEIVFLNEAQEILDDEFSNITSIRNIINKALANGIISVAYVKEQLLSDNELVEQIVLNYKTGIYQDYDCKKERSFILEKIQKIQNSLLEVIKDHGVEVDYQNSVIHDLDCIDICQNDFDEIYCDFINDNREWNSSNWFNSALYKHSYTSQKYQNGSFLENEIHKRDLLAWNLILILKNSKNQIEKFRSNDIGRLFFCGEAFSSREEKNFAIYQFNFDALEKAIPKNYQGNFSEQAFYSFVEQDNCHIDHLVYFSKKFLDFCKRHFDKNNLSKTEIPKIETFLDSLNKIVYDLALANNKLVPFVSRRYSRSLYDIEDGIQEGFLGLIKAAYRFKLSKNTKFSTYAVLWIQQSITRCIDCNTSVVRIPTHFVEKMRTKRNESVGFIDLLFEQGVIDEIWKYSFVEYLNPYHCPQDKQIPLIISKLGDEIDYGIDLSLSSDLEQKSYRQTLSKAFESLKSKEKLIICERYGLIDGNEKTLEQVGEILGVTRERIRQIERKSLDKLKCAIK